METIGDQEQENKKLTEIKTFPVPLSLGEIKESITIPTKNQRQISKEEIIKQALTLHSQGNLLEAAKYYQNFIDLGFSDPIIFSNFGIILATSGDLTKAEKLIRKSIETYPEFINNYFILGNISRDLGKLLEAEIFMQKFIELNPNFSDSYLCMGNILKDLGKNKEAFDFYLKAIKLNPKDHKLYSSITTFIKQSILSELDINKLKSILIILIKRDDIFHSDLLEAFKKIYENKLSFYIKLLESEEYNEKIFQELIEDDLLINVMKKIPLRDFKWEKLLTIIRNKISQVIAIKRKEIDYSTFNFIISLAEQCFINEYVFSLNNYDYISIDNIIKMCKNKELNEVNIAILACYYPLYKLIDKIPEIKFIKTSDLNFNNLVKLQLLEPKEEIDISKNILKLGSIKDKISIKVKSQYEENPYPRWRYGNPSKEQKLLPIQIVNNEIKPNSINSKFKSEKVQVLIAGCGTGYQTLYAQKYKGCEIIAIDLSMASLSFAQRRINELNINNVDFIQMDILEVSLLQKKFDIIICTGVLHHMKEPLEGLKALLGVLKYNGLLKLGLYSELARSNIIKARNYIQLKQLKPNINDIRNFRSIVFSEKVKELNSLIESPDFYTLSSCRDLCFHSQEHRFTIPKLNETISSNKLKFLGFVLPHTIKSIYNNNFPEDKTQTNLQNWARFEEIYADTFAGLYQFWVSNDYQNLN
ncbi:methyltransferase domain-containing protein [Prochlorococcus marinus]|uniref:methyltransferase domain-containing protein n=1 Tax=Prochlorococcus marinus TaxID=1219 RepID=UPI0022B2DDBC|nr:methyltransferase domain-containing protein [Prochlorococcus marinus]